jgi:hypothetical protein
VPKVDQNSPLPMKDATKGNHSASNSIKKVKAPVEVFTFFVYIPLLTNFFTIFECGFRFWLIH